MALCIVTRVGSQNNGHSEQESECDSSFLAWKNRVDTAPHHINTLMVPKVASLIPATTPSELQLVCPHQVTGEHHQDVQLFPCSYIGLVYEQ